MSGLVEIWAIDFNVRLSQRLQLNTGTPWSPWRMPCRRWGMPGFPNLRPVRATACAAVNELPKTVHRDGARCVFTVLQFSQNASVPRGVELISLCDNKTYASNADRERSERGKGIRWLVVSTRR